MKRSIHPFLFGIYPIIFLFSYNIGKVSFFEAFLYAAFMVLTVLCLWLLTWAILKSKEKGAIVVSVFLLLFFSYGQFYILIETYALSLNGIELGNNKILISFWALIFFITSLIIIKTHHSLSGLTRILNITGICLVIFPLANIVTYSIQSSFAGSGRYEISLKLHKEAIPYSKERPDIYYIILDGYGREDTLKELYRFDNSGFTDYLRKRGFYIAAESTSNYPITDLSLASSLNFEYLDMEHINKVSDPNIIGGILRKMISHNNVFNVLRQNGYKAVSFSSGASMTELRNADLYVHGYRHAIGELGNILINITPIPAMTNFMQYKFSSSIFPAQRQMHRSRMLYTLAHIADYSDFDKPVVVFAHILTTHLPFVFGREGEPIDRDKNMFYYYADSLEKKRYEADDKAKYINQMIYMNKKIIDAIDSIFEKTNGKAVIILQADHGPGWSSDKDSPKDLLIKDAYSILNAYYFPDNNYNELYDSITPVNTFRVIFNHYFGTKYKLLEDKLFFSIGSTYYKLIGSANIKPY